MSMNRRIYRAAQGPSWVEVFLGAALSVALGVALGIGLLPFRPIMAVKELPPEEERKAGDVYLLEGSRDPGKARMAPVKKKSFLEGQSITLTEDELNVLAGPAPAPKKPATPPGKAPATAKAAPPPAPKSPGAKTAAAPEPEVDSFVRGTPNFRLREGDVQIAVPITVNVMGLGSVVTVWTNGQFVKEGEVHRYAISAMHIGSLPVSRLPWLATHAREQFLAQPLPDGLEAAWAKVAKVTVANGSIQLTMP
jgi:hypothetical protein